MQFLFFVYVNYHRKSHTCYVRLLKGKNIPINVYKIRLLFSFVPLLLFIFNIHPLYYISLVRRLSFYFFILLLISSLLSLFSSFFFIIIYTFIRIISSYACIQLLLFLLLLLFVRKIKTNLLYDYKLNLYVGIDTNNNIPKFLLLVSHYTHYILYIYK